VMMMNQKVKKERKAKVPRMKSMRKKLFAAKYNGDFMKPFPSFYDPKAMEPPLTFK